VIGLEFGSDVIILLEKAGDVGVIVRWAYMVLLFSLGGYMLYDYFVIHPRLIKKMTKEENEKDKKEIKYQRNKISEKLYNIKIPPMISFPASGIEGVSIWVIFLIFLFTGFLSGFLGVGGGFIIMPALIYLIGLPTTIAVGTSLITVLFSGAYGCFTYSLKGRVELIAAFIMLIGAAIGAQIGSTAVKYVKGYGIRLLFAIMIVFAGCSVALEQIYKISHVSFFQTTAGIVLMGTAVFMILIIIARLIIESRREKKV
jgi:uncharacterized membrane protein YfcA